MWTGLTPYKPFETGRYGGRGSCSVILGVALLCLGAAAWSASSGNVRVEVDGVRLSIPHQYVGDLRSHQTQDRRNSVLLDMMYPDLRAATALERTTGHISTSSYIRVRVSQSLRADYAENMATELDWQKSAKAHMQQIARVPDSADLPGFEVYARVRGDRGSVVYVKQIVGEQVRADCHETAQNPGCRVSFRWQKNIHVRYFFRRHWLPELERLHTGLKRRLESFVISEDQVLTR